MPNDDQFSFNISLSVLNHLGRNLYRNFITVLGEAISNSWDADANNVWIFIDRDKAELVIKDDGIGMTGDDFRGKFLKVGYSKRGSSGSTIQSPKGRPFIGRKGIGKLALLSCAKKISVITKTVKSDYVGGTIDNSALDDAITDESTKYDLESVGVDSFDQYTPSHDHGTIIFFDDIHEGIKKTEEYLRKVLALYFRFSLIDSSFNIFLNGEKITEHDLHSLAENTQFLWNINNLQDPYVSEELTELKSDLIQVDDLELQGFIASVVHPRNLKIVNTDEKTGIDLFVNGRLREKNILRHLSAFSTRHIASYLYGQIHFNALDGVGDDSFTTSRESIKDGNKQFNTLLQTLKDQILKQISEQWDIWREENKQEGDDDNPRKSKKQRKAQALFDLTSSEYEPDGQNSQSRSWIDELRPDAEFNIPAYVECFLSENLLRKKVASDSKTPSSCMNMDPSGRTCEDRYNPQTGNTSRCAFCKGEKGVQSLQLQKSEAGTSIQIRNDEENILMYLDYLDLAKLVDNTILREEVKAFKPLRNSVMHTSRLTGEAKTKLTSVFDNVVATVKSLIHSQDDQ